MKLRNFTAVVLSASVLSTAPSYAASTDFIDNGIFTTDTISSLDWLDVTASVNQSFNYVSSQFDDGGVYEGWRYATRTNFLDMVSNYTDIPKSGHHEGHVTYYNQELKGIFSLFGVTLSIPGPDEFGVVVEGYVIDDSSSTAHLAALLSNEYLITNKIDQSSYVFNGDGGWDNLEAPFYGSYLVRESTLVATPIPAAAFLFAPALLGFLGLRRKSLNTTAKI